MVLNYNLPYRLIVFFVFASLTLQGQVLKHYDDFDMYWAERFRDRCTIEKIIYTSKKEYTAVTSRTYFYNFFSANHRRYFFEPIDNMQLTNSERIQLYGGGKKSAFRDFAVFNNQLLFVSERKPFLSKNIATYYHIYNPDERVKENHGFPIASFDIPRTFRQSNIHVVNSTDQTAAAYFSVLPGDLNDFPRYHFAIFDSTQRMVNQGSAILPYRRRSLDFKRYFLTSGGIFLAIADLSWSDNSNRSTKNVVFMNVDNELIEIDVDHRQHTLRDVECTESGDHIVLSGLYSEDDLPGIRGIFMIKIDPFGDVLERCYKPFTQDFIVQAASSFDAPRTYDKQSLPEGIGNYRMQSLRTLPDGTILGTAEHHAIEERISGAGAPGTNRLDTYYYRNGIIVYKLSAAGKLLWNQFIPKRQQSMNDNGYYLSFTEIYHNNALYLLFNDHLKNYEENHSFAHPSSVKTAVLNNWRNTIAVTKINADNGAQRRWSTLNKNDLRTLLVPQRCVENRLKNELFLYANSGNRHRFGQLNFVNKSE
ncbi:MAG: hypothetical protein ACQERC_00810 [Bacteroidota bacterium]